jgi:hypothetical protein
MDSERTEQSESKTQAGSKRAYRTPELRALGTVRALTLNPGCINPSDGVGARHKNGA